MTNLLTSRDFHDKLVMVFIRSLLAVKTGSIALQKFFCSFLLHFISAYLSRNVTFNPLFSDILTVFGVEMFYNKFTYSIGFCQRLHYYKPILMKFS